MSIFSNIKDDLVVNTMSRKKSIDIEELSKLSEEQIRKLMARKEINLSHFSKRISSPELAINLTKLYKASKTEYDAVIYILRRSLENYDEVSKIIASTQDVLTVRSTMYEEMIKKFTSDPSYIINADLFPEGFKRKNNDIFLLDVLPEDVRNRYYNKETTEKDLLENIEIFHNLKQKDIIFNSVVYNSTNSGVLISKLGIDNLYEVIKEYGQKFTSVLEDQQKLDQICKASDQKEGNDYYTSITNCLYTNEELSNDLGVTLSKSEIEFLDAANIKKIEFVKYFNETFSNFGKDFSCHEFINSLSSILKSNKDYNNTYDLFEKAAISIIGKWRNSEDFYTPNFMERHQQYFLPSGIKLNPATMYEDIKNNLNSLSNTNISAIFYRGNQTHCSGLFDNNCFLKILELYNGDLVKLRSECNFYSSLESPNCEISYIHSYDEFLSLMKNYYDKTGIFANDLTCLEKLGFDPVYIEEIKSNLEKYGYKREDMAGADLSLLSNDILQKFDSSIVKALITYYGSGASKLLIEYSKDEILSEKLNAWFALIKNSDASFLNFRNINYIILSFKECIPLVDELLRNNTLLDKIQMRNLLDIIINKNKYNVRTIEELTNYTTHKKNTLKNKLASDNIIEVKDAIYESLFSISSAKAFGLINFYQINNTRLYKKQIEPSLPVDIAASIRIIAEIFNTKDINKLKSIFSDAISIGSIGISSEEIEIALRNAYTKIWNSKMFKGDTNKTYYVAGVNSEKCQTNINGQSISSDNRVKVVELDGEPFNLIVHGIGGTSPDNRFQGMLQKVSEDPSIWNTKEGATTISTSLISNTHMQTAYGINFVADVIYYGFNYLPENVIRGAKSTDAGTAMGGGYMEVFSTAHEITTPEGLISNSTAECSKQNEVILMRRSSNNNQKFDGRVQPNCIVTFSNEIDDNIKLSAQYFDVPIYKINLEKYKSINEHNKNMYLNGQIGKLDRNDIETIFSTELGNVDRVKLCSNLCYKAVNERLISEQEYYSLMQYIIDYTSENDIIVQEDSIREIQDILNYRSEEIKDGITK